ncbi:cupin domain-containing protein [Flavobacterium sp.]|uniref:cupin domain-containing protein n=1 Tax=Flavobacterium sp. TaxID=239 RepID=UPI002C03DDAD|nr:cupin domain-containing protein [Flavobacterium sp.]HSD06613.1 cupin domain-containing protein [Flavobacterium sp.]
MSKEVIKVGQLEITFLLESYQTNGQIAIFELLVPAGAKVPLPHYHEDYDETIYGLEGKITFNVAGQLKELHPGESLFIARGISHGFDNLSSEDCKALAIVTPALIGPEYFKEIGAIVNAGGPPDMEKIKDVFKKHGIVPVFA